MNENQQDYQLQNSYKTVATLGPLSKTEGKNHLCDNVLHNDMLLAKPTL